MLNHIHIRDLVIVKALELDFQPGMSTLTGETGAGKSVLVDALGLALGGKASSAVVRQGAQRAEVTATFDLDGCVAARDWLAQQDLAADDECILRRVIAREGRSRAYVNGSPVPVAQLRALGDLLVDIHGQHAHQSLLRPATQLSLLDAYAGHGAACTAAAAAYRALRDAQREHDTLQAAAEDRASRMDYLAFQIEELQEALAGDIGIDELDREQHRLAHAERLLAGSSGLAQALDGDEALVDQLGQVAQQLDELAALDRGLGETAQMLESGRILLQEAADGLRHYRDGIDLDPARLAEVDGRLGRLHDLARKHRVPAAGLPELLLALQDEQEELRHADVSLQQLDERLETLQQAWRGAAEALSASRRQAAARLAATVTASMQGLGMHGGRLDIAVQTDLEQPIASGADRVSFRVAANPGQPAGPLAEVASGGELSRISLAIQVATADCGQVPTLIFDEVDVGIGGGTAEVVGRLLRDLGHARQVLCVTHLPQVAAQAHAHYRVNKMSDGATTETRIESLGSTQRVDEVARMLGGVNLTEQTLAHAREMLEQAS